jgi:tetrapyrrole methylase family protein / MazG family protein
MAKHSSFAELVAVMARLRSTTGCPWDREQDHASLKPYLLEEAYEALEAIDAGDDEELKKELGDVLLQVVFHAQIAAEEQRFAIDDVCRAIVDKLIHRHPHVFGTEQADDSETVLKNWERIKKEERQGQQETPPSALDGVPQVLPALLRAQRVQHKASRVGFDWPDAEGPLEKVAEEFEELRQAIKEGQSQETNEEFGDLLFALVNVGRFLDLTAEDALRLAVAKFERRFRAVEDDYNRRGVDMAASTLEEMDQVWDTVKEQEKN